MPADDIRQPAGAAEPLVRIRGLGKAFGGTAVLHDIDLDVHAGEVVVIIGPSGSGKSTLLKCMNLLENYDSGCVVVAGEVMGARRDGRGWKRLEERDVVSQRRNTGMVFQHFNLFQHLTALENVASGPRWVAGKPKQEAHELALRQLALVGLAEKAAAYPSELSGGQQQRVAIARALAMEPRLMLFDEPTSALDAETVGEVLSVMRGLAGRGMTMVLVTHELEFARSIADRIVFMEHGRILSDDTPGRTFDPAINPRISAFLQRGHADDADGGEA